MRNIFLTSAALAALVVAIGCTVSKEDKKLTTLGVPEGSVQVADGTTRQSYTADHSVHVYVYDATSDRLVYQDRVRNGDRLTVDPNNNRLELNGQRAVNRDLATGHRYRIYFYDDSNRAR